jgi:hypothetical protein
MQVNICGKCQQDETCDQECYCPYIIRFSGSLEEFEKLMKFVEEKQLNS